MNFIKFLHQLHEDVKVVSSKRQGIEHFKKMKDIVFLNWMKQLQEKDFVLDNDLNFSIKVDGLGFRFGKDASGRFFVESSRSDPIYDSGTFMKFTQNQPSVDEVKLERAQQYDEIFDVLKASDMVHVLPNDTKIVCEMLYHSMATKTDDGLVFVNIAYDQKKLGQKMTIVPIVCLQSSTGEVRSDQDKIMDQITATSNAEIKIVHPTLKLDKTINIASIVDLKSWPMSIDSALQLITSRKVSNKDQKKELSTFLEQIKNNIGKFILSHSHIRSKASILGKNIEGIVFTLQDDSGEKTLYKIIDEDFTRSMKAKKIAFEEMRDNQRTPIVMFLGRLQPIHNGHQRCIDTLLQVAQKDHMEPVVNIVKGVKSSENKEKNPLDLSYQEKLLHMVYPSSPFQVTSSEDGNIDKLIEHYRRLKTLGSLSNDQGFIIQRVIAGEDRDVSYEQLGQQANSKFKVISLSREHGGQSISATAVREAIKNNQEKLFQSMVPKEIYKEWTELRKRLGTNNEK